MQKLKTALQNRRGETIVEVLVAFVLLMLFLALFTASLRFARRAAVQAQTTRDDAYMLMGAIYPADDADADEIKEKWKNETGTTADMRFSRSENGSAAFIVKGVQQQTCTAEIKDEKGSTAGTHTFTRYYKNYPDTAKEDTTP